MDKTLLSCHDEHSAYVLSEHIPTDENTLKVIEHLYLKH